MAETQLEQLQITFPSGDQQVAAFLARPMGEGPFPAVVVVHEIYGLVPHMADVVQRFAQEGFVAMAPDLYNRNPRPGKPEDALAAMALLNTLPPGAREDSGTIHLALEKLPEADRARIGENLRWLRSRDPAQSAADVRTALEWLRQQPFVRPSAVAVLGFCMGGGYAVRLAAEGARLGAAVVFYGENPPLEQVPNIRCPVLGLYGAEDQRITDTVPQLVVAMQRAGKSFTYHVYPGAGHAFFNDTSPRYRPQAAADAWPRTLAFLRENLA